MNRRYLVLAGLCVELTGLMIGAFFLGSYLDEKYKGHGIILISVVFAAFLGWVAQLVFFMRKLFDQDEDSNEKPEKKS